MLPAMPRLILATASQVGVRSYWQQLLQKLRKKELQEEPQSKKANKNADSRKKPRNDPTTTHTTPVSSTTTAAATEAALKKSYAAYTRPKVGVGVFLLNSRHPGKILLGKRKGSDGSGTYALPGGHLEFGEDYATCAAREVLEETNLTMKNCWFGTVDNSVDVSVNYHYVTIFMVGEVTDPEECKNLEPDKCEGWSWVDWHDHQHFPGPLFTGLRNVRTSNYSPFNTTVCHNIPSVAVTTAKKRKTKK